MKKILVLIIISILAGYKVFSQAYWQKTYDFNNGNTDLNFCMIQTSHNHLILCGATTVPSIFPFGFDGYVLAVDVNSGDTLWSVKLGSMDIGAQNDFLFDMIENHNHEIVLTGIRKQGQQSQQLWIVKLKLNPQGTQVLQITEKLYGLVNDKNDGGARIIQNSDGSYIIAGFTESQGTQQGGKDAWLLKLNANLDTLWTRTYDFGYEEGSGALTAFQNGYLLAVNSVTGKINFPVPYYTSFSNILYLDTNGNVLKSIVFDRDTLNSFSSIRRTPDGGAVLLGSTSMYDNDFGGRDIFLVKLNSAADTVWSRTYGKFGKYDGGTDILVANDGAFYVATYSQSEFTNCVDNWWFMKLNSNGDTLYTKWLVTLPDNDDPACIIKASDGSIIASGWINANSNPANNWNMGNADILVIKMDTLFSINTSSLFHKQVNNTKVFYPNPFSEKTTLTFEHNLKNATLKMFDAFGRTVLEITGLFGQNLTLNRPYISNGIYWVSIFEDETIVHSQKLIVCD